MVPLNTIRSLRVWLALLGAMTILLGWAGANCYGSEFQNGSCELGTNPDRNLLAGSTDITGWEVLPANIDWVSGLGTNTLRASDGKYFVDLNGTDTGGIQQTFDTNPGTTYTIDFDLNSNNDGPPFIPKAVQVSAAGVSQGFIYTGGTSGATPWQTFTFMFTATASQTTLVFQSLLPDSEFGPLLDNVRIIAACAPTPVSGCAIPAKSRITLKDTGNPPSRLLLWDWLNGTTSTAQLGDPVTGSTSYAICLYDDGNLKSGYVVLSGGTCGTQACWKATSTTGFRYKNPATDADGIFKVRLRAGTGTAKIKVKGKGPNLSVPLPITQSTAVTVQLVKNPGSGPECWSSAFVPPPLINTSQRFKDREP